MKICPKCNEKFESGKFCKFCGAALQDEVQEIHCTSCGAILKDDAKFCSECGAKIDVSDESENTTSEETETKEDVESVTLKSGEEEFEEAFDLMYSDTTDEADFPRAFELFKKSADKGYGESYFWLARCYDGGLGCDKDDRQAVYWYKKAVEYDDDPYAAADLGEKYLFGEGITEDKNKAYQLFKKSASKDVAKGQFWLGWCSINGEGCDENQNRAYQNFNLAVKNGYGNTAKLWLARCYETGTGVNQNPNKAYQIYQELADEGNSWGLYGVGQCFFYGFGTNKNTETGLSMIQKAADSGECDEAKEFLKSINTPTTVMKASATTSGALIGTAIMPGLGTLIGGGIGWLAGKFVDEKVIRK